MRIFQWENCYADVLTSKHSLYARSFFDDVILPAMDALKEKVDVLSKSENLGDVFAHADAEEILRSTKLAFGLAIQALWERQFRGYLRQCVHDLRRESVLIAQVERGTWENLCTLFEDLRDINLKTFPSYSELEILHLFGNACRHGDGPSATRFAKRCPDFWKIYPVPTNLEGMAPPTRSVDSMDVPIDRLHDFILAIIAFWNDVEYIYCESIRSKHSSLEARLEIERTQRLWLPLPPFSNDEILKKLT